MGARKALKGIWYWCGDGVVAGWSGGRGPGTKGGFKVVGCPDTFHYRDLHFIRSVLRSIENQIVNRSCLKNEHFGTNKKRGARSPSLEKTPKTHIHIMKTFSDERKWWIVFNPRSLLSLFPSLLISTRRDNPPLLFIFILLTPDFQEVTPLKR